MFERLPEIDPNQSRLSDEGELIPHNSSKRGEVEIGAKQCKTGPDDGLRERRLEEIIFGGDQS